MNMPKTFLSRDYMPGALLGVWEIEGKVAPPLPSNNWPSGRQLQQSVSAMAEYSEGAAVRWGTGEGY